MTHRRRARLRSDRLARRRGLYRNVRARRVRPARPSGCDHHLVARATLSNALSHGAARRITHARGIGKDRHRRSGVESHGSGALVDSATQSETRGSDSEIPDCRLAAVAVRVCPDRSFDSQRSAVERFERWARIRLAHGFSLDEAAKAVAASKRTIARRMETVLGKSPLSYFQSLRVERAVHLLKTGNEMFDQIAARVGYADGVTLRTLRRRHLGYGIREIRRAG
jgi:transcriptional regulator GlxA family with amidase domain